MKEKLGVLYVYTATMLSGAPLVPSLAKSADTLRIISTSADNLKSGSNVARNRQRCA